MGSLYTVTRVALFALVMKLISRTISTNDALRKIMYASDLIWYLQSIGKNCKKNWAVAAWSELFQKHWLKRNLENTEVMWVGKQRERERERERESGRDIERKRDIYRERGGRGRGIERERERESNREREWEWVSERERETEKYSKKVK